MIASTSFLQAQTRQLEKLQEISGNWFDRARREASLASELAIKLLMAARSAPEVASAYHDRETSHMDRAAEDAKRILTNAQGLAESGRQFLSEAPA
jgi:hypothetical protein